MSKCNGHLRLILRHISLQIGTPLMVIRLLETQLLEQTNNLGTTATPGGRNTPLCPSIKRFGLRYRRWSRPSEHIDLIPEFMSIIWSRRRSNFSWKSFLIWTSSDQKNPLELIEGSGISFKGLSRLVASLPWPSHLPRPLQRRLSIRSPNSPRRKSLRSRVAIPLL